jgi:predicted  nucleic acid-binding Zn-ribbon protein
VPDAPWRCSQCGTVNEPVANACRTCGRWPSLFELEGSTIEADEPVADDDAFPAQTVEVEQLEPEVFEPDVPDENTLPPEFEPDDEELEPEKQRRRVLPRLLVPIGIVVYIVIRALVDN